MLYTGRGDKGDTSLFGSKERLLKDSAIIEALGTVDELNAAVGLCRAMAKEEQFSHAAALRAVQEDLFVVQAELAGAPKQMSDERLKRLEKEISEIESLLPPITTFFIPGETVLGAQLDVARTVARRAERRMVAAELSGDHAALLPYINRLSSLLYALARLASHERGASESAPSY